MSSNNEALEFLSSRGHHVQTNPGACVVDGSSHVPIDGELRSMREIHEMLIPLDKDIFAFEARDIQYEVHICYLYGGAIYQIYQDGKEWGSAQEVDESALDLAQRIADSMGGHSLRRL